MKTCVIYDSYDPLGLFTGLAEELFVTYCEEYSWKSVEDIPSEFIQNILNFEMEDIWSEWVASMKQLLSGALLIISGIVTRWDGRHRVAVVCDSFEELSKAWRDCDYIKVFIEDGTLQIKCTHHDGTNYFTIKRVTLAGQAYLDEHEDDAGPDTYEVILDNPKYSTNVGMAQLFGE